jgi:hypothetical protein
LTAPNVLQIDIKPTIDPLYPWCVYSITLVKTKTTAPDTSANVILFTDMVDKVLANIANAFITLKNSPYGMTDAGVYNLQVTYSWALPI